MAEIRPFREAEREPADNVVELLEEALAEARRGEFLGAALILWHPAGESSNRWAITPGIHVATMVGSTTLLAMRLAKRYAEDV